MSPRVPGIHHDRPEGFPYASCLQPGDRITFGQGCAEPVGLLRELLHQGDALQGLLGKLKIFVGGSYSGLMTPAHRAWFDFASYGAIGQTSQLARAGCLDVHPVHYSQLPRLLGGELKPDVVLLQVSAPDEHGRHSLGAAHDYQVIAARHARVVIAEVNPRAPYSPSAPVPADLHIDHWVRSDEPLIELPRSPVDAVSERIAGHVAGLVPDGATLQVGVGSVGEAICRALVSHHDLGIHSGILTDGMADLIRLGAVTNERKSTHAGLSVVGSLLGSRSLLEFAHRHDGLLLADTIATHVDGLQHQTRLCAINSAVEVDLTGQINAEVSAGRYIGAVGGQVDFLRAASRSEGGAAIVALPSTAASGTISRIVGTLGGPVTTPRSDVDHVVTEWGVASLRGLSLRERARRLVAIAHPDHRDALKEQAQAW